MGWLWHPNCWYVIQSLLKKLVLPLPWNFDNLSATWSIQVWLAWRHDVTQWFIWDPGISVWMPLQWTNADCLMTNNLGVEGFVMFPFLVSVMMQSGWTSRVGGNQFTRAILHHQRTERVLEEFYGVRWSSLTVFHHGGTSAQFILGSITFWQLP